MEKHGIQKKSWSEVRKRPSSGIQTSATFRQENLNNVARNPAEIGKVWAELQAGNRKKFSVTCIYIECKKQVMCSTTTWYYIHHSAGMVLKKGCKTNEAMNPEPQLHEGRLQTNFDKWLLTIWVRRVAFIIFGIASRPGHFRIVLRRLALVARASVLSKPHVVAIVPPRACNATSLCTIIFEDFLGFSHSTHSLLITATIQKSCLPDKCVFPPPHSSREEPQHIPHPSSQLPHLWQNNSNKF